VGCLGSGGNILIKPIVNGNSTTQLLKKKKKAAPGSYSIRKWNSSTDASEA
jgi:hypothetical protein